MSEATASGSQTEALSTEGSSGEAAGGSQTEAREPQESSIDQYVEESWAIEAPASPSQAPAAPEPAAEATEASEATEELQEPEEPEPEEPKDSEEESKETEESEEDASGEDEAPEEEPKETPPEETELHYLGETVKVNQKELKELAERGMNLGRLRAKLETLEPLAVLQEPLEAMSELYGTSTEQVIRAFQDLSFVGESEVASCVAKGIGENEARQLVAAKIEAARAKAAAKKKSQPPKTMGPSQQQEIEAFARLRPDIHKQVMDGETKLPVDVLRDWQGGNTLAEAWLSHENRELAAKAQESEKQAKDLRKQVKQLEKDVKNALKKAENAKKAPGPKQGVGGGAGVNDIASGWNDDLRL